MRNTGKEFLENWGVALWIGAVVGTAAAHQPGYGQWVCSSRSRKDTLGWAQGWGELFCLPLFCLVKVGLKPQLKISASARVLQEGNDKRNWLLSYKFCLGCRASLNAGQGRNKRKTKASMFCNHNALELCDLVLNAWAGCSLIVSLWCYLTPTVKQCSLPASVGKIDSATCKNSTGL